MRFCKWICKTLIAVCSRKNNKHTQASVCILNDGIWMYNVLNGVQHSRGGLSVSNEAQKKTCITLSYMVSWYNPPFYEPRVYHFRNLLHLHSTLYTTSVSIFFIPLLYHSFLHTYSNSLLTYPQYITLYTGSILLFFTHHLHITLLYIPAVFHSSLHTISTSLLFAPVISHVKSTSGVIQKLTILNEDVMKEGEAGNYLRIISIFLSHNVTPETSKYNQSCSSEHQNRHVLH